MPLAIDLFCGLGGWAEGLLSEGWHVIGVDLERHRYPKAISQEGPVKRPGMNWSDRSKTGAAAAMFNLPPKLDPAGGMVEYPADLILQDVRTLHGAQFRDADLIVASPPCQFFSRMAMPFRCPWKQDEFERRRNLAHDLFWQCWRIQHEASEAAGRYIPMVVENVCGAQKWVGDARWHYGSYYLWGDVPALMPNVGISKNTGGSWFGERDGKPLERNDPRDMRRNDNGDWVNASTAGGWNHPGKALDGTKRMSGLRGLSHPTDAHVRDLGGPNDLRRFSSRSSARKAASAMIAKIPFALAQHIARVYYPAAKLEICR